MFTVKSISPIIRILVSLEKYVGGILWMSNIDPFNHNTYKLCHNNKQESQRCYKQKQIFIVKLSKIWYLYYSCHLITRCCWFMINMKNENTKIPVLTKLHTYINLSIFISYQKPATSPFVYWKNIIIWFSYKCYK